jgi:hypothetical protein
LPQRLIAFLRRLGFPQTHPRPSAVLVDELDAGRLKATPYDIERGSSRFVCGGF